MVKGLSHLLKQAWDNPDMETEHGRLIKWRA